VDCRIGLLPGTAVAKARAGVARCVAAAAKSDNCLADGYALEPGTAAEAGRCRRASPPR
jgi:hypothetical protein